MKKICKKTFTRDHVTLRADHRPEATRLSKYLAEKDSVMNVKFHLHSMVRIALTNTDAINNWTNFTKNDCIKICFLMIFLKNIVIFKLEWRAFVKFCFNYLLNSFFIRLIHQLTPHTKPNVIPEESKNMYPRV